MDYGTDTFRMMNELIGSYGLKEQFLWDVIGPQASVMQCADTGYIELLGSTLRRISNIHQTCTLLSRHSDLSISIAAFIQEQVLAYDADGQTEYLPAGEFIASGLLSPEDAVTIASGTTLSDLKESKVLRHKAGRVQWKPNKYQHFLRAIQ